VRMRRAEVLIVVGAATAAAVVLSMLPLFASDEETLTLRPVADTTMSRVPQDGDNSVKTTLASCPRHCDGNLDGRRDALLAFTVSALPETAVDVRARLVVYAWDRFAARVLVRTAEGGAERTGTDRAAAQPAFGAVLQTRDGVAKGYNDFDVSPAIRHNGTYTFALQQETHNTRIYWASKENRRTAIQPRLVLSYRTAAEPSTPITRPTTQPPVEPVPSDTPYASPSASGTALTPSPHRTRSPGPVVPGWRLVWRDEFNDNDIDRSKWNIRSNEGRDIDIGCNTNSPRNSFESGGKLTLRAMRETTRCSSRTRHYTQGYLDTIGKHSWKYGRFEIRAKSPNVPGASRGLWPAFWLRPADGGDGEIDVVELPGGDRHYRAATQSIFQNYSPVKQDQRWTFPSGHPADGFHTYATEWEPTAIRWYVDGKLVWKRDRGTTPWFDRVFHKPYNMRLNFQVGGWLGNPDATTRFPADFVVDYVRVHQR
jgi:beta-glucanase (GH16 family)